MLWNTIVEWFKSKGGVAHVLALVWLFLVAAYAAVPSFHALVIAIKNALPGPVDDALVALVALIAFYKNWTAAQAPAPAPPQPPKIAA
jgi:hypothetical protein